MDALLGLIPKSSYPHLEKVLRRMLDEVSREVYLTHQKVRMAGMHKRNMDNLETLCIAHKDKPDNQAIALISQARTDLAPEVIAFHLKAARKKAALDTRTARNRQIAILARKGHTNADIARLTGVSPTTAARIAAKAIKGEL